MSQGGYLGVSVLHKKNKKWENDFSEIDPNGFSEVEIKFYPGNWINTYNQWLNNIQDWCISRQLWWGHQIPAWYGPDGRIYVAHSLKEAQELAKNDGYTDLHQDADALDTWFSSGLWPFATLGWPDNKRK